MSPQIQQAKAAHVEISSQTKLFFDLCPAKIIGVTGTNGKGTTSSIIAAMLTEGVKSKELEVKVYLAGNIGQDPFIFLDKLKPEDWVVLELSSFQLQDLEKSPHIAVVLNITTDHLDKHKDFDEYFQAKGNLLRHQEAGDYTVIAFDSETAMTLGEQSISQDWYFSRRVQVDRGAYVRWLDDEHQRGVIILREDSGHEIGIIESDQIPLRGEHNLENVAAAVTASYLAGVQPAAMVNALRIFTGLSHRLELVAQNHGISCYDDSIAATPEPVIAAVRSFHEPIHLIVGGRTKGVDFTELGQVLATTPNVKTITPLGNEESVRIVAALEVARINKVPIVLPVAHSMDDAVDLVVRQAHKGDVILLSPGATSFDLYTNYKERGDSFAQACRKALSVEVIARAKDSHGA